MRNVRGAIVFQLKNNSAIRGQGADVRLKRVNNKLPKYLLLKFQNRYWSVSRLTFFGKAHKAHNDN